MKNASARPPGGGYDAAVTLGETVELGASAVSWAAIIGGAFTAAAITLILLALGGGIGLTTVSPWSNTGASATSFGVGAVVWLIVVEWIASGMGGYITGRLRTKWVGVHTDEVFFRDTAHGFLSWALATVVAALFLASAVFSAAGGAAHTLVSATAAAAPAVGQAAQSSSGAGSMGYFTDTLFRAPAPTGAAAGAAPAAPPTGATTGTATTSGPDARAEATRILVTDMAAGSLPAADRTYLAQLISTRTGLSQADAEKRVDAVVTQIKQTADKARALADKARKTAASVSIITALSMLIGAFIASAAGALGGRRRDEY